MALPFLCSKFLIWSKSESKIGSYNTAFNFNFPKSRFTQRRFRLSDPIHFTTGIQYISIPLTEICSFLNCFTMLKTLPSALILTRPNFNRSQMYLWFKTKSCPDYHEFKLHAHHTKDTRILFTLLKKKPEFTLG